MAWPTEAGAILTASAARRRREPSRRAAASISPATFRGRHYLDLSGQYRVFNDAEYRFYRTDGSPPEEGDTPYATASSLPAEPSTTFADGDWYIAVSYFNGILDSGFLPIGAKGERYRRLVIDAGAVAPTPPDLPIDTRLQANAAGVVRIHAIASQQASGVAGAVPTQWAIAYTTDGSTPATDTPTITPTLTINAGVAILQYDLPAQTHGTTVKVRVQTRRNEGASYTYSAAGNVLTATATVNGASAPLG